MNAPGAPLLTVDDLHTYLATGQGVVRAVDGVSFTVGEAEVVGIVGESGCGKTVTCRTIMGLMPKRIAFSTGRVVYHPLGDGSILDLPQSEMQRLRGAHLAMIFQDPMTALNPVRSIGDQLIEAVTAHAKLSRQAARERAVELLTRVGIPAPVRRMRDYPFQFSGGMLQRALIAIALASAPRLLLADEPTTSLDVIIQDQILKLLLRLQRDNGLSLVLVSHDLSVVAQVCDRVAVMYAGQVVELADVADVLRAPKHPYTAALLESLPGAVPRGKPLTTIPGAPPQLIDLGTGCRFADRCAFAQPGCTEWTSELLAASGPGHQVRCVRHTEIQPMRTAATPAQPTTEREHS